ncbi:F-box protein, partial [Vibrio hyugaensis]|uniref:F-box protein n=1 Tax=Vibrio hyugaensis TaxID=1534743 RepID=UPI0015E3250B
VGAAIGVAVGVLAVLAGAGAGLRKLSKKHKRAGAKRNSSQSRSIANDDVREFSFDIQGSGDGALLETPPPSKKLKTTHPSVQEENPSMSSMPLEMIDNLSKYLDDQSIKNLSQTSKYMNQALQYRLEKRQEIFHLKNKRNRAVEDAVRQVNNQRLQRIYEHRLMNRNTLARIERRILPSGIDYIDNALEDMDVLF